MTDEIKDLLALAVPDAGLLHASGDAAADLSRGRRSLRHRRVALVVGTAVAIGAVAGGVATAASSGGASPASSHRPLASGRTSPSARASVSPGRKPSASASASPSSHPIALVAYTGQQVPGYQVAQVPNGWTIQGGNAFVLTLAPIGYQNTDINSFLGKLVVMTEPASEAATQSGTAETVNGQPGKFWIQGGYQTLIYRDTSSTWVDIQAPPSLSWDATQIIAFANGVKVLANAQQSKG